ncbi:MAG: redoxin domain-containing protein, partial [Sedimentisphaerales bacterium]|nr:redoxin domain-containing protein [Sedimentisphaerales bacterium]
DAWEAQIYPDGSFDINSIPTGVDLRLTIEKPGYKTAIDLDGLSAGENLELGQIALEPTEERGQDTQWNCSVEGFIINENNEPLAGAKINTGDVGERRFEAETDAGGWYKLTNLPKDVEIKMFAFAEGYGNNPFTYNCSEPNNTADIQIFPPAYDWYDKPAPPLFVERWFNSEPIALEELAGQVILLHVGVNLKERPEEIRELKELSETYAESPLVFIAIHERARDITEDDIQQFLEENDVNFPFGIDQQSDVVTDMMLPKSRPQEENLVRPARRELQGTGATCSMYEVKAARTYYLIDKNGLLRISPTQTNLEEWIEYLLNE